MPEKNNDAESLCEWCGAASNELLRTIRATSLIGERQLPNGQWHRSAHLESTLLCTSCSIALDDAAEKVVEMVADAQSNSSDGGMLEIRMGYCNAEYDEKPRAPEVPV